MASLLDDYAASPVPGIGSPPRSKSNCGAGPPSSALQDMGTQLAEISKMFAASQAQSAISQRRADVLSATNSRLRKKLGSVSKQVEQARQFAYHDSARERGMNLSASAQTAASHAPLAQAGPAALKGGCPRQGSSPKTVTWSCDPT